MNPTLVHQMLEGTAERLPEQLLVIEPKERHDYASMNAAANHLAATLLSRGMRPGDHVALLARNSAFYVEAYYGVLKAGGVVVALNTASDEHMLVDYLRMSRATTLIVGPGMERLVKRAAATIDEARLPALKLLVSPHADELGVTSTSAWCYARAETSEGPGVSVDPNDLAAIVFTSGSTGRPRGAMLTHGNIVANVTSIVRYLELTADDRVLQVLPFYYVYGKSVLNTHVMVGGTVVVENRFRYPKVALDTLEQERCTGLSGVPSTFAILLDRAGLAERELGSLRYVTQAGGAMSPALTRQLMEALPDTRIYVMYGATEASARLAYLPPDELPEAIGSVGRAIDGVTLKVLREDGTECDVDEVGELVAQGPNIMRGYLDDPEETARVLSEHGYHTGDLARRDARGLLYVVGRSRNMIKVGGHRLSPLEIEHAIMEDPAVAECAVIGIEDALLGSQMAAFVTPSERAPEGLDGRAIAARLQKRVPAFKIPRVIELVDELPKNESGKVMKAELKARMLGGKEDHGGSD